MMRTNQRDLDDQVTDLFPLDGPYDSDHTRAAALSIAGLVRYLNHATYSAHALEYPSNLAGVISSLSAALAGMQQLVGQLAQHGDRFSHHPDLYADNGADPVAEAQEAIDALHAARVPLAAAYSELRRAHAPANRLGIRD